MIGNKGYLSTDVRIDLFNYANILLDVSIRSNQKKHVPQFSLFRKKRKIIETLVYPIYNKKKLRKSLLRI